MENKLKVSCFGAGFVGLPTMSVLALYNPQADFTIFDIDEKRIQSCKQGKMPIYEPGLEETFKQAYDKNLRVTTNIAQALDNTSVIFLALPTPTKSYGQQSGKAYDLSYTETAIVNIANYYNEHPEKMMNGVIIVEKSTVPIGTAKILYKKLTANLKAQNKKKFILTSNPQFLAEGTAINDLKNPDRVVLGSYQKDKDISNLTKLYSYAGDRVIYTNSASSQLSKLAANCFLAQRVSAINSIALICQQYDADVKEVKKCLGSDTRIGEKFLNSGPGFGGSCFQKDILALIYLAECKGLTKVANFWQSVIDINNERKVSLFKKIYNTMGENLKNKKIAIFGTAFKKGTCDIRQSPALDVCRLLLIQGAILNLVDPQGTRQRFIAEMKYNNIWQQKFAHNLHEFKSAEQATNKAHAIVVMTEWDEFKTLPYEQIFTNMLKPSYIFDSRLILDQQKLNSIGFQYIRVGKRYIEREVV